MSLVSGKLALFGLVSGLWVLSGCAAGQLHPCGDGGEPAREKPAAQKGDKQCTQRKDATGKFVNDGPYVEWFPNGKRSLLGEYRMGKRHGKWIEWDESGKKLSERWFEDGVETSTRADDPAVNPASKLLPKPSDQKPH